ncbi:MAG TPA: Wzz/FepE/Etk N-terminal domain-containing protein [Ktedonobacteraceae bacterium]|nr:Wzz/FepE/Etk N-terminal domain-containing protein [Ktedonobacteraceae bacterium]
MEIKAYIEGIWRKWWFVALVLLLSLWMGGVIANNLTPDYTASTTILLNDNVLANTAFPSGDVRLSVPIDHEGLVLTPATMRRIMKTYPRLNATGLQKQVVVSTDQTNQLLLISVTDISPFATADIANFLARQFVHDQTIALSQQVDYYQRSVQQSIARLSNDINKLNAQIVAATPATPLRGPIPLLTPQQRLVINELQVQVGQDKRSLYAYQQSSTELQQVLPQLPQVYTILKQAVIPDVPNYNFFLQLPKLVIRTGVAGVGLLLALILIIGIEFFTPFIRHRGELLRLIGIPATAEIAQLRKSEQKLLLEMDQMLFKKRIKPLRLLGATMSALATRSRGHTVLLTSPCQKRDFAALLAAFQAYNGLRTLLIDADFEKPGLHERLREVGPSTLTTVGGRPLSFVSETTQPNLFLLPATALSTDDEPMTNKALMDLLPELQEVFDIIIIDTPPLDRPTAHLLTAKVAQVLLFVKKRQDTLKSLKKARLACETLKLEPHYVFLT